MVFGASGVCALCKFSEAARGEADRTFRRSEPREFAVRARTDPPKELLTTPIVADDDASGIRLTTRRLSSVATITSAEPSVNLASQID